MNTQEALQSFDLDPRLFYDAMAFSTDDYLYVIDMATDRALISDNMKADFDLPDCLFRASTNPSMTWWPAVPIRTTSSIR